MTIAAASGLAGRRQVSTQAPVAAGRRFFDTTSRRLDGQGISRRILRHRQDRRVLVTVLGSCVSACIRDPRQRHRRHEPLHAAAQPFRRAGASDPQSTRYGNFAMEKLINELIKAGCSRDRSRSRCSAAATSPTATQAIGTQNAEFVLRYLEAEGLRCAAQDLGGQSSAAHSLLSRDRPGRSPAAGHRRIDTSRAKSPNTQPPVVEEDGWRNRTLWDE